MTLTVFSLVLLAAVLHAWWNFAVRTVAGDLSVLWLGYWLAALVMWPVVGYLMLVRGQVITWDAARFILVTGCVHTSYMYLLAKAYEHGEISLVYPIARGTGVAGTAGGAFLLLAEPITAIGGLGIAAVCVGVLLLGLGELHLRRKLAACLIALAVGCIITTYSLIDSRGVTRVDPIIYLACLFTMPAILMTPYILLRYRTRARDALRRSKRHVAVIALGGSASYLIALNAFKATGGAGYVVAVRESSVIFGAMLGFVFLRERLTWRRGVGILIVAAGLVMVKLAGDVAGA